MSNNINVSPVGSLDTENANKLKIQSLIYSNYPHITCFLSLEASNLYNSINDHNDSIH